MSFLHCLTLKLNPYKKIVHSNRKEETDSHVANKQKSQIKSVKERTSAFTSKGSMTLEAAIVVPIFFFAILSLAYLLEMMSLQTVVSNALHSVGKKVAEETYAGSLITATKIEKEMVEHIGPNRLNQSIILGGASGFDCKKTKHNRSNDILNLSVQYRVEIPVLLFRIKSVTFEETLRIKGWSGYEKHWGNSKGKNLSM